MPLRVGLKQSVLGVKGASGQRAVLLRFHPPTSNPSDPLPRLPLPPCPRFNTKVAVDEILELRTANAQLREENRRLRVLAGEDVEAGSNSTPLEQLKKMKAKELLNLVQVTEARVHCRHPNPYIHAYIHTYIHTHLHTSMYVALPLSSASQAFLIRQQPSRLYLLHLPIQNVCLLLLPYSRLSTHHIASPA